MVACGSKEPKQAVLAGRYLNLTNNVLVIESLDAVDTITLADDGTFSYKIMLKSPAMLKVRYGRTQTIVYLQPGDSSFVEVDAKNPALSTTFTGSNSELNQNIKSRSEAFQNIWRGWRDLFSLDAREFSLKIDSISKELLAKADSAKAKSKTFAEMEANRIRYFLLNLRSQYPQYSSYLSGKQYNRDSADYSFLDRVDMNNGEHLTYDDYAALVETYAQLRIEKMNDFSEISKKTAEERLPMVFSMIDSIFTNPRIRDFVKKKLLLEEIQFGEFWKLTDVCT